MSLGDFNKVKTTSLSFSVTRTWLLTHTAHDKQCKVLVPLVFNSFFLHFLQLAGITGLGGSFFLHKYNVYGVFFSSLYIILPAKLAVAGGVVLLISGCIGCSVSSKQPSCGHGFVRWKNYLSFFLTKNK